MGELLSTAVHGIPAASGRLWTAPCATCRKMREMGFPVFARGTCVYDSSDRQRVIDLDVPVEIDGVRFAPGDLVIADSDGVVVVPQAVERRRSAAPGTRSTPRTKSATTSGRA